MTECSRFAKAKFVLLLPSSPFFFLLGSCSLYLSLTIFQSFSLLHTFFFPVPLTPFALLSHSCLVRFLLARICRIRFPPPLSHACISFSLFSSFLPFYFSLLSRGPLLPNSTPLFPFFFLSYFLSLHDLFHLFLRASPLYCSHLSPRFHLLISSPSSPFLFTPNYCTFTSSLSPTTPCLISAEESRRCCWALARQGLARLLQVMSLEESVALLSLDKAVLLLM